MKNFRLDVLLFNHVDFLPVYTYMRSHLRLYANILFGKDYFHVLGALHHGIIRISRYFRHMRQIPTDVEYNIIKKVICNLLVGH